MFMRPHESSSTSPLFTFASVSAAASCATCSFESWDPVVSLLTLGVAACDALLVDAVVLRHLPFTHVAFTTLLPFAPKTKAPRRDVAVANLSCSSFMSRSAKSAP